MSDYYQLKRIEDKVDSGNFLLFFLIFGGPSAGAAVFAILGWSIVFVLLLALAALPFVGLYKLGRWLEDRAIAKGREEREAELDRQEVAEKIEAELARQWGPRAAKPGLNLACQFSPAR